MDNSTEEKFDFANWGLSKTWQFRFEFFEDNGLPKLKPTAQYKENFKKLPFWSRVKIGGNFWSFFFGPLYFLCLGMWRKAISLTILLVLTDLIFSIFNFSDRGIGIINALICAQLANPAYYLHRVKKSKSFNIFEGLY
ncbi:MAG: DUF2628 domain-containing protein [Snodgrassella sp.]|uniref:DUF2628 domain-containing protein n=1 Tax=Snodgrassella sp. TaxID=2815304 RepID=UPI0025839B37|nr:DUF2628 domain-containing protein [Snodgrassella sp.]MCO6522442.1 DUF2628 domain-containing protein [Snodgrassella sp.]